MTTATQNLALQLPPGYFGRRNLSDWLFALFVAAGAGIAFALYSAYMDGYEQAILIGMVPSLVALAWFWRPVRQLTLAVAALSLLAIWLYQTGSGPDLCFAP